MTISNSTGSRPLKGLGIYIHIPFCVKKCNYCDFVSFPGCSSQVMDEYIDALCADIRRKGSVYRETHCVDTIFIGGGTPTMLSAEQMQKVLTAIGDGFRLNETMEISMESNPGTFDKDRLRSYMEMGINRLSIGVQSLDDGILKSLGRIHGSKTALDAIRAAKSLGINLNVDLMLGIPGQTMEIWEDTLKKIIAEDPQHISFYSLQLEMHTPFYEDYRVGKLDLPTWEENRVMYHRVLEILKDAGYKHYEVSNACKPGYECRHNIKYWTMQDYIGVGIAAHSFVNGARSFTTSNLKEYIASGGNADKLTETESLEDWDLKTDFIFTELRLIDGFSLADYKEMFGCEYEDDFGKVTEELEAEGYMEKTEKGWKLTLSGLDNTNNVMERLMNE
ncbi:MAG: radical SAM family heme chaperone HemW [Clostridia bacterium]|nr:radical SAM family heme chaperone HemW [Clostridia bacterium]